MSKRKPAPLDADDVLAGRVKPSAADLLQLIHRENPTGRELGARETELRYARKARLQSLLVRRFAADLEVTLDAAQPGTVSLRHRGHGRDGCHAVLAALDEDARSWAQRELDLAASATPHGPAPSARPSHRDAAPVARNDDEGETPEALLRRAEAAIESYDYEAARAALEQALDASHGAAGPATALLALLVETLGDDAGALAIEPRIAAEALSSPRLRAPLALAAARSGQEDRAVALVRGLDDAPAATIFAALAASALGAGDLERAQGHVEQARRRDPTAPGLAGVASEVAAARAKACAPAEAEIGALLAAGREAEAEKRVGEVLARWPESARARRALREIEERRGRAEAVRLATEADEAAAQGDEATALARLAQAAATARGAEREAIEERARRLEASARERRDTERVGQTLRVLDAMDPREGLTAYAALDEASRARVRARSTRLELAWIDRMPEGRGGDRARADAATALLEARDALGRDPQAAITLLAPHEAWLERVPEARRITREAEAAIHAGRLSKARAAITSARAELAAGAADEALARLGASSLRELSDEERAEAAAIEVAATRLVDRRRRSESAQRLRAAGRLFEARTLAEGLAAGADDAEDRARWERERDAIREEIRQSFRVEVDDTPRPAEELGRFRPFASVGEAQWWLTADGRGVVSARAYERWVVVRVLDREAMRVHPTILLRTPEPLGAVHFSVCGPTLWLIGQRGALLEIAMADWEVRDFRPSADVAAPTDIVETAVLVAAEDPLAPRYFWIACRAPGSTFPERVRVIDLAQRRVVRELPMAWQVTPLAGLDEPRVAATKDRTCTLHTPHGAVASQGRIEIPREIHELAVHPSTEGLVAIVSEPTPMGIEQDLGAERSLFVASISVAGGVEGLARLPGGDPDRPSSVAAARGSGLIHAIWTGEDGPCLIALAAGSDRGLMSLYNVEIGGDTVLVQDSGARRIVALTVHDGGVDTADLGPMPPEMPVRPRQPYLEIPGRQDVLVCDRPSGARNAAALALAASWRSLTPGEILHHARALERDEAATAEQLVEVVFALRAEATSLRLEEANHLAERLSYRFGGHPEVRLLGANDAAAAGRWGEIGEWLVGVDPAALDESRVKHLHHLRALAALGEGRFLEATEPLNAALALEGRCELASLVDLLGSKLGRTEAEGTERSPLAQLVAAVQAADACFAAGDPAGARSALDRPVVWAARETQSLARLAEAYLAQSPGSAAERLRSLETLGTLLNHLDDARPTLRRELPLPEAWGAERIAGVAARARGWLDAQGAPQEG